MGHLVLAQEAAAQLGLDEVLLVPAGNAPHKRIDPEPGKLVRLEMTELAAGEDQMTRASDLEVARDGPSYTFETLEALADRRPEDERWFLMGADMAAGLAAWERPERVVELASLGVVPRPGVGLGAVNSALERLGAAGRAEIIDMPLCGASSTTVRQRAREGKPLRHLVPDGVIGLIEERGLYR